ncbi:MAG: hypothetical protein VKL23_06255 [Cyanobacteriota bacterium]|nr:hypothetical protein [Cyanobacteriota bacterium]
MPTLQVKIGDGLLQVLRDKAKAAGCTQAEYVTAWLEGLAAGEDGPEIAAEVSAATAGSNAMPAAGAAGPVVASTTPADQGLLEVLQQQLSLLQELVGASRVLLGDRARTVPELMRATVGPAVAEQWEAEGLAARQKRAGTAMPVVLSYDPLLGSEVAGASPAAVSTGVHTGVSTPAPAAGAEPEPEADVLAAERARQQQELKAWQAEQGAAVAAANEIERRSAFAAAGHAVADAAPAAVEPKGNSAFAEQLKAAAAQAAAAAETAPGMGGSAADAEEESVTADTTPDSAQVVEVEALQADPADDDLEARVAALEELDRAMEDWLAGIQAGGEPVAPPLAADASEGDWQAAAEAAVVARGKKPLPELIEAALKYWGRG